MNLRSLSRRRMLGGAAVAIGLPFLESLAGPRQAHAQSDRLRLLCIHFGNGHWAPSWTPPNTGPSYTLSPTLAPFAKVKDKLTVLTGLHNRNIAVTFGAHNTAPPGMLTCRPVAGDKSTVRAGGPSMDQLVANKLQGTRIKSLQTGVTEFQTVTEGWPAIYRKTVSWAGPTEPLPPNAKPGVLFDRIYAGFDPTLTDTERSKRAALKTSVLDYVREDAKAIVPQLAAADRPRLERYLTGLSELEKQVQGSSGAACGVKSARPADNLGIADKAKVMSDLIVIALQCNATRVITHNLGSGGDYWSFGFLGLGGEYHHSLSHYGRTERGSLNRGQLDKFNKITHWQMQQIAYLLEKMDAVDEGNGSLLYNSVVYVSSEISDGDRHDQNNKPTLVAGRAGGLLPTGRHIKYDDVNQSNLFTMIMNLFGLDMMTFGAKPDGRGPLNLAA